jgi:hypothetical protein
MINIQYTIDPAQIAQATSDFLNKRPIMRVLRILMLGAAVLLNISLILKIYWQAPISLRDILSCLLAIGWVMFYKHIHKYIIAFKLRRSPTNLQLNLEISSQQINFFSTQNASPSKLFWQRIKLIYKTKEGYIVPLTGLSNAGKFLWLPLTSLAQQEQQLTQIIAKHNITIRHIQG